MAGLILITTSYYQALFPPSAVRLTPVMKDEASEQRNIIVAQYSSASAILPSMFDFPNLFDRLSCKV